mgnify:CR=1 FL=1
MGDEFIVVMPNVEITQAEVAARRVAKEIKNLGAAISFSVKNDDLGAYYRHFIVNFIRL